MIRIPLNDKKGFTLAELVIVLGIIMVLISMGLGASSRLIRWQRETDTKRQLEQMLTNLQAMYQANAWSIDSSANHTISFTLGGTTYAMSNGTAEATGAGYNNLAGLQAVTGYSGPVQYPTRDAMHNVLWLFISNRLTDSASGAQYHVIALVSSGWDGKLSSTFNQNTGALTISGDDIGISVSGLSVEAQNINNAIAQLDQIRDSLQNYYTSLYLNDSSRNVYVDRFANQNTACAASTSWDPNSAIKNSKCVNPDTLTQTGVTAALGLSSITIMSPWEQEYLFDNGSSATRNPDVNGQVLPYTGQLLAALPWGGNIQVTVNGMY